MATTDTKAEDLDSESRGDRSQRAPGTGFDERWAVGLVAFVAAMPSLVAGLTAGFMTDDWWIAMSLRGQSLLESLRIVGFEQPGRPLAGFYYSFLYEVVGEVPWVHGIVIGAVNAAVVGAAWLVGRRFLSPSTLWPALVVLALAPNHAMTRIWFVAGYYPLALAIVLVGLYLLDTGRTGRSSICFVVAALLFEGVLGFGLAGLGLWMLVDVRNRIVRAIAVGVPTLAALAVAYAYSSKRGGSIPFGNADSLFSGQLGVGLWGSVTLAQVAGGAVLIRVAWAIARQMPSFRGHEEESRVVLLGVALALGGALPFLLTGATFATTGVFDRNNLAASVGVAVLFGGLWSAVWRFSTPAAVALGALVIFVFVAGQAEDLRNWSAAYDRGEEVIDRLAASDLDDAELILVVPEQEAGNTGMADFIYDGDLTGALRHRVGGDWSQVRLIEGVVCDTPPRSDASVQVVDWRTGAIRVLSAREVHARCEELRRG